MGAQQRDFGVPSKRTFGCPAKGLSCHTAGAQKGSFRKQIRDVKVGRGDTTLVRNSASQSPSPLLRLRDGEEVDDCEARSGAKS